jgi:PAS domain S-box-containing protein
VRAKQKSHSEFLHPRPAYMITPQAARLLDVATDAAFEFDLRDDRICYWSRSAEELYGWKKSEALGKRPGALLKTLFPRPLMEIKNALLNQGYWKGDLIHLRRDGTPVYVKSNWAIFQATYKRPICLEINTDISEQVLREQKIAAEESNLQRELRQKTTQLEQITAQTSQQGGLLHMAYESLRDLSSRLLHAQDEERRHIARDLHDSMGQGLALLVVGLSILRRRIERLDRGLANQLLEQTKLAKQLSEELRTVSYLLHPPLLDEMGLLPAIRAYVEGLEKRCKIRFYLDLPHDFERLSADLELAIFRVIQECLTNIHRHSGSPVAYVHMYRRPEAGKKLEGGLLRKELVLQIADEGRGIPPAKFSQMTSSGSGVGLRSIRERIEGFGGRMEIASAGKGTQVNIYVPLP